MTDAGDTNLFVDLKRSRKSLCFGRVNDDFGYTFYEDAELAIQGGGELKELPNNSFYIAMKNLVEKAIEKHLL